MAILTWRKRQKNNEHFYMPPGSGVQLTHIMHIDDDGCECLKCSGQTDLYALIQSHRESCDLAMLLRGLDPNSVANAVSTFRAEDLLNTDIIDYSVMPTSLGGMFNLIQKGENLFSGLPEEIRREFNYSVKNFVGKFGTPEFNEIVNKYLKPETSNNDVGAVSITEPNPDFQSEEGDD